MSTVGSTSGEAHIDLSRLFSSLLRNWPAIALVAVAVAGTAFAVASLATPHYRAETTVSITTARVGTEAGARPSDEQIISSQVGIFASTDLLRDVIAQLEKSDPAKLAEFDDAASPSLLDRLLVASGLKSNPADVPVEERVLTNFRDSLTVKRGGSAREINIAFSSQDPMLAAQVPQLIARTYTDLALRTEAESRAGAIQSLSSEIEGLSMRVKAAEARVSDFRAQPDLRGTLGESHMQQLTELSAELARSRANRAAAEADAERVRLALGSGGAFPNVISSSLIQNLHDQRVKLHAGIADLSTRMFDNQPRIDVMKDQLRDLDRQIAAEAEKVLRGLANIAKAAKLREDQLVADLDRAQAEAKRGQDEEAELRSLQREAAAGREQLGTYRERYREAQARRDSGYLPPDALTISAPAIPLEPYFPKAGPIAGAALGAGILLTSIVILLRELFSGRAKLPAHRAHVEPVEQVRMPAFEAVLDPAAAGEESRQATHDEQITDHGEVGVHEAAQMLITGGATRALFVSPQGDEAAATAVMVARDVADAGLRVLLVDLTTIGAPSAPMLDGLPLPGITDLLAGTARFTDVIHEDHYSDCHVIPIGQADQRAAMRAVGQLPMILDTLNSAYDVVIVECGSANAESIHRLVSEGTEILVSVLQPIDEIVGAREDLLSGGYEGLTLVTPANDTTAPYPDRSAA